MTITYELDPNIAPELYESIIRQTLDALKIKYRLEVDYRYGKAGTIIVKLEESS